MVKRVLGEPNLVTVTFERDSEEPERLAVADGWLAAVVGVGLIIARRPLLVRDHLTVKATD
jgi:hypothetical protein